MKTRHPVPRGLYELALLSPVDSGQRASKSAGPARLHFDKHNHPRSAIGGEFLDNEVDVAMPAAEPPLDEFPSTARKPILGDSLALFTQQLTCRKHGREATRWSDRCRIDSV